MTFGLDPWLLNSITKVLERFPEVASASIFGSRAKGTYAFNSDIDIAIHAPTLPPKEFARLSFDLNELPIVFKMDIVHADSLSNEALSQKIQSEEKTFYPSPESAS